MHLTAVKHIKHDGEQEWYSGESAGLPPVWSRFEPWTWRDMWFELFVSSGPFSEGFFLRVLQFFSFLKNLEVSYTF